MSRLCRSTPFLLAAGAAVALSLSARTMSHETWTGCTTCHGEFTDATSPGGSFFPSNNKHTMHRSGTYMDAECTLCHTAVGDLPFIGSSAGTVTNPGIGCTGCHEPLGLRAHHVLNGVDCTSCHEGDPAPPPENTVPTYYGTIDTKVDDPCNTSGIPPLQAGQEVWTLGDTEGLDNDGDNLYDAADPDCGGGEFCPSDITGPDGAGNPDGNVDALDFLLLIGQWGTPCAGSCEADITGPTPLTPDGNVDSLDFLLLIAQWGSPGNC